MEWIFALFKWSGILAVVGLAVWGCVQLSRRLFVSVRKSRKAKSDRRQRNRTVRNDRRKEPRRDVDVANEFVKDLENR